MEYPFKLKPYAHQLKALEMSWDKPYFALFMDMGTGKSKVLIDNLAILYDKGEIDSAIAFLNNATMQNDQARLAGWAAFCQALYMSAEFRYIN